MFRYHFGHGRRKSVIELPHGNTLEPHSLIAREESSPDTSDDARSGRSGTVRPFKNRIKEGSVSLAVKHSISTNYDLEGCQRDCRIWNKVYPHLPAQVLINNKNPKEFRYVMPHLGISLAEFKPATIEENLHIQLAAVKALRELHKKGVAHGDINLGNILITKVISSETISYQAYIIDFEYSQTTDVPDSDTLKPRTKDDIQSKMRMDIAKLAHILNYFHDKPVNEEQAVSTSPFSFSDSPLKTADAPSRSASGEKESISGSPVTSQENSSNLVKDDSTPSIEHVSSSNNEDLHIERVELLSPEFISPAEK